MSILGIDPGRTGAAVYMSYTGSPRCVRFQESEWTDVLFDIAHMPEYMPIDYTYIENVHAMPSDSPHNAFEFGRNTGIILGYLYTAKALGNGLAGNIIQVAPQTWQRFFDLGGPYKNKTDRKNAHKKRAQEIYPYYKMTLDICDAFLIAEYGKRTQQGEKYENPNKRVSDSSPGIIRTTRRESR